MPVYKKYDPLKVYKWGDSELTVRTDIRYRLGAGVQDYHQLKAQYAGQGWSDPEFPHDNKSIGTIGQDTANLTLDDDARAPIRWYRVRDVFTNNIVHDYHNFHTPDTPTVAKYSTGPVCDTRKDIKQGGLGSCFFVASVSCIATNPKVLENACPSENNDDNASGVYHFIFWYQGCYIDVPVDDWLPFKEKTDPNGTQYVMPYGATFNVSGSVAEYWVMLIEKAYAKLYGSYGAIDGGLAIDALQNLTGGFVEQYKLQVTNIREDLFEQMRKNLEKNSLISVACNANQVTSAQVLTQKKLCFPHAYTVTKVATVQQAIGSRIKDVNLVRLYNPHGQTEWNGPWSDYKEKTYKDNFELSDEWYYVSDEQKKELQVESKNEGEFWMSFDDMTTWFSRMDIVSFIDEEQLKKPGFVFECYDGTYSSGAEGELKFNIGSATGEGFLFAEISQKVSKKVRSMYNASVKLYETAKGPYNTVQPVEGTTNQLRSVTMAYRAPQGEYTLKPTGMNNGTLIVLRVLYTQAV